MKKYLTSLAIVTFLGACSQNPMTSQQGYIAEEEYDRVEVGSTVD